MTDFDYHNATIAEVEKRAEDKRYKEPFVACNWLGYSYLYGRQTKVNIEKAAQYFDRSANQDQDQEAEAYARYMIGVMIMRGQYGHREPEHALTWLETAAENGCTGALIRLGQMNEQGILMDVNHAKAASLFLKSFLLGDLLGAVQLGFMHVKGKYFKQNDAMGIQYFKHAKITAKSTIKSIEDELDMDLEPSGPERQTEIDLYKLAIVLVKSDTADSASE